MLRVLVILSAGLMLSGCLGASVPKGYVSSDPCIRCGQGWQFMPNEPNASIRNAERVGFEYGMGADPKLPLENLIGGSKKTITVEKKVYQKS